MTKTIGLTGGIGSGKTTIANYFNSKGIPIYIADIEARKIMQSQEIIEALKVIFGTSIFDGNILIRQKLADIVFNDPEALKRLNGIVHPAVKKHYEDWLLEQDSVPYIVYESAILFENDGYKNFDYIISVTAPVQTRIDRVMDRDAISQEQVQKRVDAQWSDEKRISKSDFIIENSNLEQAKLKVDQILKILKIKQKES
ncbi:dephospho-CoA kinase [Flavobacterium faecale]|uniref:Dephospho-CoA kinase n=1 Tax=Flavobacterium faecale TaxID=1355330 RepID=A0A2S1LEX9_9FLAO|nr:dephospho-CoA kinase [Flavobacterium faecale]AWG22314.1 dephospho-CoA kinase [Flavobacterium faecale]